MKMKKIVLIPITLIALSASARAQHNTYDDWDKPYIVQALLGAVQFENLKIDDTSGSDDPESVEIDLSLIPQFGAAWGTLPKGDRFQYGLETSFLIGLRFDDINYISAGGNGLYVSISTSMWMFDLAGGGYASLFLDKNRKTRIYVGGGPLMTYVDYRSERDEKGGVSVDNNESTFGIGLYARAGFEFRIYEAGMLGLGARGTWSSLDLSDVGGKSELTGIAAFISFTAGL